VDLGHDRNGGTLDFPGEKGAILFRFDRISKRPIKTK
jgi:hypothetical protein